MANPQPTDHHLKIAHSIVEAIMMRDFTKRQRKVLDLILRLSWGCGKKDALIPRLTDFAIVGIGANHIKDEIEWLTSAKVININGGIQYGFNKDYDQWKVSLVMPYSPQKMKELIHINLNGNSSQIGKEVPESGSSQIGKEVPTTGSDDFPKGEVSTSHNGKSVEPTPDSPKDSIKDSIKDSNTNPIVPFIKTETWNAFIEMRKKMKAPPTENAVELLIKQLAKLKESGDDPNLVLEQSIMNNWKGLFALKNKSTVPGPAGGYHGTNAAYKPQPKGSGTPINYIDGDAEVPENQD